MLDKMVEVEKFYGMLSCQWSVKKRSWNMMLEVDDYWCCWRFRRLDYSRIFSTTWPYICPPYFHVLTPLYEVLLIDVAYDEFGWKIEHVLIMLNGMWFVLNLSEIFPLSFERTRETHMWGFEIDGKQCFEL